MKKRKIFQELLKQKDDRKMSFLLGARQVGKTTLLKALYDELCTKQKRKGIYLDLDIFTNFEKVSSFENLLNFIELNGYQKNKKQFFYLFLDEFQRYTGLSIIMKNVYDNLNNVKIYASGSSSIKIKSQIQESLAGRKRINLIYPLDFEEFLWFKEDNDAIKQFSNIPRLRGEDLYKVASKLNNLLNEFLVFGGYPEVILKTTPEEKIRVLESIFDLYVKKDLVEYLNIKKIMNVKKLIEYLAINNAQKIKYDEVSQVCQLDYNEVKNYIELIKETYLISILRPFYSNKNKELTKIPKIYYVDNGVRNYFINNFNPIHLREDKGYLFEGYVLSEFLKLGVNQEHLKFWQDKNRHEIDIIIDDGKTKIPVEIKFKHNLKNEDFIGIKSFTNEYNIKKSYVINLNIQNTKKSTIMVLPFNFCKAILQTKE